MCSFFNFAAKLKMEITCPKFPVEDFDGACTRTIVIIWPNSATRELWLTEMNFNSFSGTRFVPVQVGKSYNIDTSHRI